MKRKAHGSSGKLCGTANVSEVFMLWNATLLVNIACLQISLRKARQRAMESWATCATSNIGFAGGGLVVQAVTSQGCMLQKLQHVHPHVDRSCGRRRRAWCAASWRSWSWRWTARRAGSAAAPSRRRAPAAHGPPLADFQLANTLCRDIGACFRLCMQCSLITGRTFHGAGELVSFRSAQMAGSSERLPRNSMQP